MISLLLRNLCRINFCIVLLGKIGLVFDLQGYSIIGGKVIFQQLRILENLEIFKKKEIYLNVQVLLVKCGGEYIDFGFLNWDGRVSNSFFKNFK